MHERLLDACEPRRQNQQRGRGGARNGGRQRVRWRRWKVSPTSTQTVLSLCTKVGMMNGGGGSNRTKFPQTAPNSNNETSISCSCSCPSGSVAWTCVPCKPSAPSGLKCICNPLSCMDSRAITGMMINNVGLVRTAESYMKRCGSQTLSLEGGESPTIYLPS